MIKRIAVACLLALACALIGEACTKILPTERTVIEEPGLLPDKENDAEWSLESGSKGR